MQRSRLYAVIKEPLILDSSMYLCTVIQVAAAMPFTSRLNMPVSEVEFRRPPTGRADCNLVILLYTRLDVRILLRLEPKGSRADFNLIITLTLTPGLLRAIIQIAFTAYVLRTYCAHVYTNALSTSFNSRLDPFLSQTGYEILS
jgi:hypothetical protein